MINPYTRWQIERYGTYVGPDGVLYQPDSHHMQEEHEDFENGVREWEDFGRQVDQYFELEQMADEVYNNHE